MAGLILSARKNAAGHNYVAAARQFIRAVHRSPTDLNLILDAGLCYLALDNLPVARNLFERALRMDPKNRIAATKLGQIRGIEERADAAEAGRQLEIAQNAKSEGDIRSLVEDIRRDRIRRPHYAHGLLLATLQAQKLGLEEMSVFEFGVSTGDGLRNLCSICHRITADTGFKFRIYGFDSDAGMPEISDYRDHPEIWYTGQFKVDHSLLAGRLPGNAKLIVGDISKTIGPFCGENLNAKCPVGFVAIDVDLYSSTKSAFKLFEGRPEFYLPAVVMYFDDVNDMITLNSWCGEALAIREFNVENKLRKIEEKWTRQNSPNAGWHDQMYCCHVLDHPVRSGKLKCASLDLNVTIY